MTPALPGFFATYQDTIERGLDAMVQADGTSVNDAMRYTLLASSKRVRAVVVLLSADLCGTSSRALPAACAIEAIHASSLILDDLPSMDDAPLRRGRPTAHKAYGEAVAILAAFGLLNEAYRHLSRNYEGPLAARLTSLFTDAVGLDGLVAGQAEDVLATDTALSVDTIETPGPVTSGLDALSPLRGPPDENVAAFL